MEFVLVYKDEEIFRKVNKVVNEIRKEGVFAVSLSKLKPKSREFVILDSTGSGVGFRLDNEEVRGQIIALCKLQKITF